MLWNSVFKCILEQQVKNLKDVDTDKNMLHLGCSALTIIDEEHVEHKLYVEVVTDLIVGAMLKYRQPDCAPEQTISMFTQSFMNGFYSQQKDPSKDAFFWLKKTMLGGLSDCNKDLISGIGSLCSCLNVKEHEVKKYFMFEVLMSSYREERITLYLNPAEPRFVAGKWDYAWCTEIVSVLLDKDASLTLEAIHNEVFAHLDSLSKQFSIQ